MTNKVLIVSTCGTSLLRNGVGDDTSRWLNSIANLKDLESDGLERLRLHLDERRATLLSSDLAHQREMSAEINGIHAVLDKWRPANVMHMLIHTDTQVGEATADVISDYLEHLAGERPTLVSAPGLRTDHAAGLREALSELTLIMDASIPKYKSSGYRIVFNLTGGFKSINAYLQALGMLYADSCVFLYEGKAAELMEIPRLPVSLTYQDHFRTHHKVFRKLSQEYPVTAEEAAGIPESLLIEIDGLVSTSVWGDALWPASRQKLFAETLMEPLCSRLRITDRAVRDAKELTPEHMVHVNKTLDALSAHLDLGKEMLQSNSVKPLKGDALARKKPSTHEVYLWSDGAAGRLFWHYEGDTISVDSIGTHL